MSTPRAGATWCGASATRKTTASSSRAGREYPLLAAGHPEPGAPSLIVTAGFHGDEKAGPLTLLAHAAELFFEHARARGVAACGSIPA